MGYRFSRRTAVLLLLTTCLLPASWAAEDHDEFEVSQTSASEGGASRACRPRCRDCAEQCLRCENSCCQICVSQKTFTQAGAREFCSDRGMSPAFPSDVQKFARDVGLKGPAWTGVEQKEVTVRRRPLLNLLTLGAAGPAVRVRTFGQAVLPDGSVVAECKDCRYRAACVGE